MIFAMPDVVPVVDRAAEWPGFFIVKGMNGHGLGAGMGRVLSDLFQCDPVRHGLTCLRLARFRDCSHIRLRPAP
jgi:glycine/D-amino acid oxidase-like deaminating enzyme